MTPRRHPVRVTANFEANLREMERFPDAAGGSAAFDAMLAELAGTIIANLERHPRLGRPFLPQPPGSVEAVDRLAAIRKTLGAGGLRDYVCGDYLILSAGLAGAIYLLSIKHHRQLSFDLGTLWLSRGPRGDPVAR